MSEHFVLEAKSRSDIGKGASRRLRREQGTIPAIVYGAGKPAQNLELSHNAMLRNLEHEAFYTSLLDLKIDGKKMGKVILKDLQRHPFKPKILHADFMRVQDDVELVVHVPLHFMNEENAVGVKVGGGKINHHLSEVEVSCLPKDLPEYIEVDVTNLNVDQTWHLSDITFPKGVKSTQLTHKDVHDLAVISMHGPRGGDAEETSAEGAPKA